MIRLIKSMLVSGLLFAGASLATPGNIDTTFGNNGITVLDGFNGVIEDFVVLGDDSILAAGTVSFEDIVLVKLDANGNLDANFGSGGTITIDLGSNERVSKMDLMPNGNIILAGGYGSSQSLLVMVDQSGQLITTFDGDGYLILPDTDPTGTLLSVTTQVDNKIIAGSGYSGSVSVVRVNINGTVDTTFGDNGYFTDNFTTSPDQTVALDIDSDSNILVGIETFSANSRVSVLRLTPLGNIDTSFASNGRFVEPGTLYHRVEAIRVIEDDNILLGIRGFGDNLMLLNNDGSVASSDVFSTPSFASNAKGYDIAVQDNGKIIVGGTYTNTLDRIMVMRFESDGALDNTFAEDNPEDFQSGFWYNHTGGDDKGTSVGVQSNGRIIVAGGVATIANFSTNAFAIIGIEGGSIVAADNPGDGSSGNESPGSGSSDSGSSGGESSVDNEPSGDNGGSGGGAFYLLLLAGLLHYLVRKYIHRTNKPEF